MVEEEVMIITEEEVVEVGVGKFLTRKKLILPLKSEVFSKYVLTTIYSLQQSVSNCEDFWMTDSASKTDQT